MSNWSEAIPSSTSAVGHFPTWAHEIWGTIASGMAVEHYWPGTGGGSDASIGELKPGAARAFFAAQSASSAPNSQMTGRAFLASDVSRLFVYDSAATVLAGTPFYDECRDGAGTGFLARQTGSFTTDVTSGSQAITFPIPYQTVPEVFLSSSSAVWLITHSTVQVATFASRWSALAATGGSAVTFYWESLGTMSANSF